MTTFTHDGTVAVTMIPAPPHLEAATVAIHQFTAEWDSDDVRRMVLLSMRAVVRHPRCDRDSLAPGRVGAHPLTGGMYLFWVDRSKDVAFVTPLTVS
jgi:hypothetical protein